MPFSGDLPRMAGVARDAAPSPGADMGGDYERKCMFRLIYLTTAALWLVASGWNAAGADAAAKASADAPSSQDHVRIWFEPFLQQSGKSVQVRIDPVPPQSRDESVTLFGTLLCPADAIDMRLKLDVVDVSGKTLQTGSLRMEVIAGPNPFRFTLDPSTLPPGEYTARLAVSHQRSLTSATAAAAAHVISEQQLWNALQRAEADHAAIKAYLDQQPEPLSNYVQVKMTTSSAAMAQIRLAFESGEWPKAQDLVRYLNAANGWVRTRFSLEGSDSARRVVMPAFDAAAITRRDGLFWQMDRPIFLFGTTLPSGGSDDIQRLARLGFQLISLEPEKTHGEEMKSILAAAADQNLMLALDLRSILTPERDAIDYAAGGVAIDHALSEAASLLADTPSAEALACIDLPPMSPLTEDDRQRFIERVRAYYADRDDVNQAWKMHLRDLSEIPIDWSHKKIAYQYDLQLFHMDRTSTVVAMMQQDGEKRLEGLPLAVRFSGDIFNLGDARRGIDYERICGMSPFTACVSQPRIDASPYALPYPLPAAMYALLHSFAPDKPIVDFGQALLGGDALATSDLADVVTSLMWDNVLAGLSGLALDMGDKASSLADVPELADAYATAALDINRLAPVIQAFRERPADAAIMWTTSSRILDNGDPFLAAALAAYEGCSFSGFNVRFVSEEQCTSDVLKSLRVLIIPHAQAISDEKFSLLMDHVEQGGVIIRSGNPFPYNERGGARHETFPFTPKTVLVQGNATAPKYLHAMDASFVMGSLPRIPRLVNQYGYPLEGVRTQYAEKDGKGYLFMLNIGKAPVHGRLFTGPASGHDLIEGRQVTFPVLLDPLDPYLVCFDSPPAKDSVSETAADGASAQVPSATVEPVTASPK